MVPQRVDWQPEFSRPLSGDDALRSLIPIKDYATLRVFAYNIPIDLLMFVGRASRFFRALPGPNASVRQY